MAKRSDLAQKLLDDIRLRKEKMGITQSSQQSARAPADKANRNSQRTFQGSGESVTNKLISRNMLDTDATNMWLGTRQYKAPSHEGMSQDIIRFGSRRVEHNIDVSMALALALSKTGKLQNIELLIMNYGSPNMGEMNGRYMSDMTRIHTDGFPFLSNLQLGEVSEGVEKLNKILNDHSKGLRYSRDSIDVGRELLKGAMDLEESLKMLVTLQEASDYMVGSNGRQIRLLKGKEDESSSDQVHKKMQLSRPRFSFDVSSKYLCELGKEDEETNIETKSLVPSYSEQSKISKSSSQKSSASFSMQLTNHHTRSLSYGAGTKADVQLSNTGKKYHSEETFSNLNSTSTWKSNNKLSSKGGPPSEKVRIPNVVAKLMGLEELPLQPKKDVDTDVKKIKIHAKGNQKQKINKRVLDKDVEADDRREVYKMTYLENSVYKSESGIKVIPGERGIMSTNTEKNFHSVTGSSEKANMRILNHTETKTPASNHSLKSHSKITKRMDTNDMNNDKETKAAKKKEGNMEENIEMGKQKFKERFKKPVHGVEQGLQSTSMPPYNLHREEVIKHEQAQKKKSSMRNNVLRQQSEDQKSKAKNAVDGSGKDTKHDAKSKPHYEAEKQSDLKLKNLEKYPDETSTKKFSGSLVVVASYRGSSKANNTGQKENLNRIDQERARMLKRTSTYHEEGIKISNGDLDRKSSKTDTRTDQENTQLPLQTAEIQISVHIPSTQKPDVSQVVGKGNAIEIPHANNQQIKQQSSVLQEQEQRCKEKNNKATGEKFIVQPGKQENQLKQNVTCTTLSCAPLADDCGKSRVTNHGATAENNSHGPTIRTTLQQLPDIPEKDDNEEPSFSLTEKDHKGPTDSKHYTDFEQKQELSENIKDESLTEKEGPFKKMLVNNQHFLNTAQALFKLEIPIGILHASGNTCPAEDSKCSLDCVYEIMRRKNRREESTFAMRLSIAPIRERSLDDLIQELNGDLESLKFPSKKEGDDYDTAEILHKVLEKDLQNSNPDINCMWDLGWTRNLFTDVEKEEVVRDVEKHILNMLINEFALDILNLNI
ncbi:hypothetical protein J5N97_028427 [Dioscorea zingiberensis]|uniref:DUF3741 domain-containing protein n=1 Tax=Dioscorea zingiberensis TaxID=325984 RepID=A0A9D5BYY8_9LILI|nr:hypothetical protein J5N97_028427 [Dioscorea zingiberensis]